MAPRPGADPRSASGPEPERAASTADGASAKASSGGSPSRDEMTIALTPSQMAVGGAVIAGLLVVAARLLLGRRRGRG